MLKPYWESHEYVVRESVKKNRKGRVWTYRLFSEVEPDPYLAVVLGDLLYDVRSALDHIAVASVPTRRKYKASFPIFTVDPEKVHPGDEEGDAARLEAWKHRTTGMSDKAMAVVRSVQPYNAQPPAHLQHIPLGPEDHALALLSAFQNADKHRQLITIADALDPHSLSIRDRESGQLIADTDALRTSGIQTHIPKNGAVIHTGKTEVDVQAVGGTLIAVRIGNERSAHRRLPGFPRELLGIARQAIDNLAGLF